MNNSREHKEAQPDWMTSALNELDESVADMDSVDSNRLRDARQTAYREAQSQRNQSWTAGLGSWLNWQSGFALACTVALVATVTFNLNSQQTEQTVEIAKTKPKVGIELIPLLTAKEDIEFYESVNFLLWLENKQGKS